MNMSSYSCCTPSTDKVNLAELSSTLKLIAEPNRLRILCILGDEGTHCVCEFAEHMPTVSQSLLSHHLADLREAGLIEGEKKGLRVYYRLTGEGKHIVNLLLKLQGKTKEVTPCTSK